MKQLFYLKKLWLLSFMFITAFSYAQSGVVIAFNSGSTDQQYNVDATGKLYFSGDNLLIKETSASNDVTIPISIIQKITFTTFVLGTNEIGQNKDGLKLYPNPSTNYIKILGLKSKSAITIYSLTGRLVQSGSYTSQDLIDVTKLTTGLYLVQVNGTTIKFIKK